MGRRRRDPPVARRSRYLEQVHAAYRRAARAGRHRRRRRARTPTSAGYRLVVVPAPVPGARRATPRTSTGYVADGGTALVTFFSGIVDEDDRGAARRLPRRVPRPARRARRGVRPRCCPAARAHASTTGATRRACGPSACSSPTPTCSSRLRRRARRRRARAHPQRGRRAAPPGTSPPRSTPTTSRDAAAHASLARRRRRATGPETDGRRRGRSAVRAARRAYLPSSSTTATTDVERARAGATSSSPDAVVADALRRPGRRRPRPARGARQHDAPALRRGSPGSRGPRPGRAGAAPRSLTGRRSPFFVAAVRRCCSPLFYLVPIGYAVYQSLLVVERDGTFGEATRRCSAGSPSTARSSRTGVLGVHRPGAAVRRRAGAGHARPGAAVRAAAGLPAGPRQEVLPARVLRAVRGARRHRRDHVGLPLLAATCRRSPR